MTKSVFSAPHFNDEAAAYAYAEARIWVNGRNCPHCGVIGKSGALNGKTDRIGSYKCYACRKKFTVKVGTIFEDSHIQMRDWLLAIHMMASSKKGVSSNQIHRTLGITLKPSEKPAVARKQWRGDAMKQLNWNKFKALVHYVCDKAADPSVLGSIKLNKVLWYSDSVHYMVAGESITGEIYVKRQHGPVPRHIVGAIDELVREKKVARGRVDHFGFTKSEFIAIESADVNLFTPQQIKLVDAAFEHVCLNHMARSVSEETHGTIWQIADMGEEIPLATVFASNVGEIDETDIAWAEERVAALAA